MVDFYAHSKVNGKYDLLKDHLQLVAERAKKYAELYCASEETYLAGILHDLGKYGNLFVRRLMGLEKGIDHWSAGASYLYHNYPWAFGAIMSVQGHHVGLGTLSKENIPRNLIEYKEVMPASLRLSEDSMEVLDMRLRNDNILLPEFKNKPFDYRKIISQHICVMNRVRMIYSGLTDSDFIETEAHFNRNANGERVYRSEGRKLEPVILLNLLNSYIKTLSINKMSPEMRIMREDLLNACNEMALSAPGIFTLSAPTGSGKTISMLYFALKHALQYGKTRIIIVLPYLNIIEQTAKTYLEIFADIDTDDLPLILEDHSLKDDIGNSGDDENRREAQRLLSQNWDAPIVITTNVQCLESLFSQSPFKCRKLHNIANSVILFDEVQTIGDKIVVPTLAALSDLAKFYGCSIVFATATQPAFKQLDHHVKKLCLSGWNPKEIVSPVLNLFSRKKRAQVIWPLKNEKLTLNVLCAEILTHGNRLLCILNTKKHARIVFSYLKEHLDDGEEILFHLSTNMAVEHRKSILEKVKARLHDPQSPCILIATQCVEAGVDIDFPVVYRSLAPFEAVAQAAGRCNRNGLLPVGFFRVFIPDKESFGAGALYPTKSYEQGADILNSWILRNSREIDIESPESFERYFDERYSLIDIEETERELLNAIKGLDFEKTSREYKVIDQNTSNLLVPYDMKEYKVLIDEAHNYGLNRDWVKRARKTSIGIYTPSKNSNVGRYIEPVSYRNMTGWGETGWFIYLREEDYREDIGLDVPVPDNYDIG